LPIFKNGNGEAISNGEEIGIGNQHLEIGNRKSAIGND
jgi:hypothetical protein